MYSICFFLQVDYIVYNDAVGLVVYYMKRTTSLSKEDSDKIKLFLTHTLSDFLYFPRLVLYLKDFAYYNYLHRSLLSTDDTTSVDTESDCVMDIELTEKSLSSMPLLLFLLIFFLDSAFLKTAPEPPLMYSNIDYHIMFSNNILYSFFRLFQVIFL